MILSKYKTRHHSEKGSILVFALIILSLILISALGMAATTLTQLRSTNVSSRTTGATQNADRGFEVFLQEIYHENNLLKELGDIVGASSGGALSDLECDNGRLQARPGLTSPYDIGVWEKSSPDALPTEPLVRVLRCDILLGDIARFVTIGEFGGTARSRGVTLIDSTNRGLVAAWGFEDSARAVSAANDESFAGSPAVSDGSRFNHPLTLCPIDEDPHGTTIPFDRCPQILRDPLTNSTLNVTPAPVVPIEDIYMDHDGTAFVAGIVDEPKKLDGPPSTALRHSEAMYFNGTSSYLAINDTEDTTPSTSYYTAQDNPVLGVQVSGEPAGNYSDPAKQMIHPTEAVTISLFVKKDPGNEGVLVVNGTTEDGAGENGYALFFADSTTLRLRVQGTAQDGVVEANYTDDGQWYHVVAMWDLNAPSAQGLIRPKIYINATDQSSGRIPHNNFIDYASPKLPFTVGGIYDGADINIFDTNEFRSVAFNYGYRGAIDELRIYDRALTENEIKGLCAMAKEPLLSNCNI